MNEISSFSTYGGQTTGRIKISNHHSGSFGDQSTIDSLLNRGSCRAIWRTYNSGAVMLQRREKVSSL